MWGVPGKVADWVLTWALNVFSGTFPLEVSKMSPLLLPLLRLVLNRLRQEASVLHSKILELVVLSFFQSPWGNEDIKDEELDV